MEVLCLMGQTEATRQSDFLIPANVDANGNPNCVSVAVTTSAGALDITTIPLPTGVYDPHIAAVTPNPLGRYINFQAQGGDVYLIFGPTFASVTSGNKPVPGTNNTVNGSTGAVTMAKGVCIWVPQGQTLGCKLPQGNTSVPNQYGVLSYFRFVAYVTATGSAVLRVWQSSP